MTQEIIRAEHENVILEITEQSIKLISPQETTGYNIKKTPIDMGNVKYVFLQLGELAEGTGAGISEPSLGLIRLEANGVIFVVRYPYGDGEIDTSYEDATNGTIIVSKHIVSKHNDNSRFSLISRKTLHWKNKKLTLGGTIGYNPDPMAGRSSSQESE